MAYHPNSGLMLITLLRSTTIKNDFWTIEGVPSFQPIIAESYLVYDDYFNYQLLAGLAPVVLGYSDKYGDRTAYYFSIASTAQYAVSTKVLKDQRWTYNPNDLRIVGYRGCNSQIASMVIDFTFQVAFYAELQSNKITCWNMNKPLNPDNIGVVFKSKNLQYPAQIFIDSRGYTSVRDAIHGTVCDLN
ncbi:hypothetical protein DMENIID0001_027330 [Sergentomyia squamirostris]